MAKRQSGGGTSNRPDEIPGAKTEDPIPEIADDARNISDEADDDDEFEDDEDGDDDAESDEEGNF